MTIVADYTIVRQRVLVGEDGDPERRGSKTVIARSECRFECPTDEVLSRCVSQIRISDEHLRNRPKEMMLWDWSNTWVERPQGSLQQGGAVVLGVAWYDEEFFDAKHDAYTDPSHLDKYFDIGLPPGSISVSHWKFVSSGAL